MNRPAGRRPTPRAALACLLAACALGVAPSRARSQAIAPGRQVTVFGVLATRAPGEDDPKLKDVLPQLRAALPGHRFKLLKVESKRAVAGEAVSCPLGDGFVAVSRLVTPLDANGKVQLRFELDLNGFPQYQTIVNTPPNQVFYVNRTLGDGDRLIIGIGAR